MVRQTTAIQDVSFTPALTGAEIVAFQRLVRRVPVADEVVRYAVHLARSSRPKVDGNPEFVRNDPAVIRAYLGEEEDEALPEVVARDLQPGDDRQDR